MKKVAEIGGSMFRLIKLAIYGMLGYVLYEFVRGLMAEQEAGPSGRAGGSREYNRALDRGAGRMNMTGPAQGSRVMSEDASGESVPHVVGRGVVKK
jgi:hypothetical protein